MIGPHEVGRQAIAMWADRIARVDVPLQFSREADREALLDAYWELLEAAR